MKWFLLGLVSPPTQAGLKTLLQKIWFTLYYRKRQPDTSGFEHAFIGEVKDATPTASMDGFHNWVHLANQEASNKTYYMSWKGQADVRIWLCDLKIILDLFGF